MSRVAPPPPDPAGSANVLIEGGIHAVENARVARAFLVGDEAYRPYQNNLPFGVILLKRGDTARNQAVCNSFINNLPTPETIFQADPDAQIVATYWLLRDPLAPTDLTDCSKLLARYNYARAERLRASYGRANAAGPIFLALQLNQGLTNPAGAPERPYVALLDLSAQTPAEVAVTTVNWFAIAVSPGDDALAGAPEYRAEPARRGRGLFAKIFTLAKRVFGDITCGILRRDAPASTTAYTEVTAIDPVLNRAVGTIRLFTRQSRVVGFALELIGDLLCRPAPSGSGNGGGA